MDEMAGLYEWWDIPWCLKVILTLFGFLVIERGLHIFLKV